MIADLVVPRVSGFVVPASWPDRDCFPQGCAGDEKGQCRRVFLGYFPELLSLQSSSFPRPFSNVHLGLCVTAKTDVMIALFSPARPGAVLVLRPHLFIFCFIFFLVLLHFYHHHFILFLFSAHKEIEIAGRVSTATLCPSFGHKDGWCPIGGDVVLRLRVKS